jgi:hypothetical protein
MIWLFHRRGEYMSCEVRTCSQNAGYELCILRSRRRADGRTIEWYPDEKSVEARWNQFRELLIDAGWADVHSHSSEAPNPDG